MQELYRVWGKTSPVLFSQVWPVTKTFMKKEQPPPTPVPPGQPERKNKTVHPDAWSADAVADGSANAFVQTEQPWPGTDKDISDQQLDQLLPDE